MRAVVFVFLFAGFLFASNISIVKDLSQFSKVLNPKDISLGLKVSEAKIAAPSFTRSDTVSADGSKSIIISLPDVSLPKSTFQTDIGTISGFSQSGTYLLTLTSKANYNISFYALGSDFYIIFTNIKTANVLDKPAFIKPAPLPSQVTTLAASQTTASKEPPKDSTSLFNTISDSISPKSAYDFSYSKYFMILGVMIVLLIILYIVRLKINRKKGIDISAELKLLKVLDSKSKIVSFKYKDKSYILGLNPNGITLIDTLPLADSAPTDQGTKSKDSLESLDFKDLLKNT
ncbi:flagellar biosynthetic protein FliO [Helicobacter sp. 11S02629-2]|uniref:flagellar biosynthetic protein FliO n=1 Tax=Helicobacter sp. 11S02629-2 TaxID=1476195 RepID=UPI000BA7B8B0|nr:flagellar biosynthetic protein FliO [Helicobacter sp. 11S02629-2]PAF42412.1 hypothetical protein BKH40_07850 [Helicobacter sp. 11S02629-2]